MFEHSCQIIKGRVQNIKKNGVYPLVDTQEMIIG